MAGDPLRALAAMSVLVYHAALGALATTGGGTGLRRTEAVFGDRGGSVIWHLDLGLNIFFVLSGYLLARPWIHALVTGERRPDLRAYLRNRALRIVPAFWVVTLATLLYFGPRGASTREVLAVPLFLQSYDESPFSQVFGQAWTLDVEMGFYILLPIAGLAAALVLRSARRTLRLAAVGAALALVFVASLLAFEAGPDTLTWQRSLPAMLFAFVPGAALALIEQTVAGARLRRACAVGAVLAIPVAVVLVSAAGLEPGGPLWRAVLSGAIVAAPLAWHWSGRTAWRALDNRAMQWLGVRSYGIYLVHNGIQIALLTGWQPTSSPRELAVVVLAVSLPITLLAAALLYRFVERPALSLRKPGSAATGHAGDPAQAVGLAR